MKVNFRCCSSKSDEPKSLVETGQKPVESGKKPSSEVVIPPLWKCHVAKHKTKDELTKIPYTATLSSHYQNPQNLVKIPYVKPFESTYVANRPIEDPNERVLDQLRPKDKRKTKYYIKDYLANYDIVIMGGGAIGCSVAYWLAQRIYNGVNILVIERDPQVTPATRR